MALLASKVWRSAATFIEIRSWMTKIWIPSERLLSLKKEVVKEVTSFYLEFSLIVTSGT